MFLKNPRWPPFWLKNDQNLDFKIAYFLPNDEYKKGFKAMYTALGKNG